jgi:hypothetical protein
MTQEAEQAVRRAQAAVERLQASTCIACGHHSSLHAAIGSAPRLGAKCRTCQCPGLELPGKDNSADERAEGGATCAE